MAYPYFEKKTFYYQIINFLEILLILLSLTLDIPHGDLQASMAFLIETKDVTHGIY